MILKLLLLVYILFFSGLYLPVKIIFAILFLYVIQDLQVHSDQMKSRPLPETLPPGTVLSYAYNNLLERSLSPLLPYRLVFSRYPHHAIVVTHQDKPHVLEWRYYPLEQLDQYTIKKLPFGYISLIPLDTYLEEVSKDGVVYSIHRPPRAMNLPYDVNKVKEIVRGNNYMTCTYFVSSYLTPLASRENYPLLFTPERCQSLLKQSGWKQDYYVYTR
jgi:hypothetical protein